MKCPNCGIMVPADDKNCPGCGATASLKKKGGEKKEGRKFFCPICKEEVSPQWGYCRQGHPTKFFCVTCEKTNPGDASFCLHCGENDPRKLVDSKEFTRAKREEEEKKTPRCETCGEKVETKEFFCLNCHEPLKKACRNCGELNLLKVSVCIWCGQTEFVNPRTAKLFKDLVVPEEVQVDQNFVISGQAVSFVDKPSNSSVYLKLNNFLDHELETRPTQGNFEFRLGFSQVKEYELELRSGIAVKRIKIKAVRRKTPAEDKSRPPMKRLCIREKGIDGSDWTCDTPIIGGGGQNYKHFCPSENCNQNQELKLTFPYKGKLTVFDKLNCKRCKGFEIGIDKFFLFHNDDIFFRIMDHPARYIPEDPREILKQACLYECPVCKKNGNPGVKQWVLVPETWLSKNADKIGGFIETVSDWTKRGFRAADKGFKTIKTAREKQIKKGK